MWAPLHSPNALTYSRLSCYLVGVGGEEIVVCHLLVKHWSYGAGHRWHYPAPVRRAALPQALLVFIVLHERLGCRVVVYNSYVVYLKQVKLK